MKKYLNEINKIPDLHAKAINYVFENKMVSDHGLWLEFGVYQGGTINRIAKYTKRTIYGFDSFEGLPENWEGRVETNGVTYPKGTFSLGGQLPPVKSNVQLIKGWYKDTLPVFLSQHKDHISFLHIDSDIYSSAKDIFDCTYGRISNGCVIVFDELVGYPGFEEHEWKAWWEFVEKHNIVFEWIGGNVSGRIDPPKNGVEAFDKDRPITENVSPSYENVAVKIIKNPSLSVNHGKVTDNLVTVYNKPRSR